MTQHSRPGEPVAAVRRTQSIPLAAGIYLLGALTTYLAGIIWSAQHARTEPKDTPPLHASISTQTRISTQASISTQAGTPNDVFAQWGDFEMTQAMVDGIDPEKVSYYRRKLMSLSIALYETRLNAIAQLVQSKATGDYLRSLQIAQTDLVTQFGPDDATVQKEFKNWCAENFLPRCEVSGTYPESEKLAQFKQSWAEEKIASQVEAIKQQHPLEIHLPAPVEVP